MHAHAPTFVRAASQDDERAPNADEAVPRTSGVVILAPKQAPAPRSTSGGLRRTILAPVPRY